MTRRILLVVGAVAAICIVFFGVVFAFYYHKYQHIVDDRLAKPLFANTAKIYAAPTELRPGQKYTVQYIEQQLRSAGYSIDGEGSASPMGTFTAGAESITIHPGPQSFHAPDSATVTFDSGAISQITGSNGQQLAAYELEPLLVTDLSDQNRAKRRLVTYDELPQTLVHAVTSIEDRRFFEHGGVDYYSILGWTWHDLRGDRRYAGGASTLTMQLAKIMFLSPERTFSRKFRQVLITFQLENHYSKQKIFEIYANQVPLGQRGSFSINGFGEAAQAYFGKDVRQLTLPECALLAGLIQSPSRLNPYRHAERAISRRNVVLDAMVETGAITKTQAEEAKATPLHLVPGAVDAGEAPYFVDLVRDQLSQRLNDADYNQQGLRIYTSLDPDLQRAATEAVNEEMKNVDEQVERLHERRVKAGDESPIVYPQVALIALNPHTGQILALVGGRNYGSSQYNHAVAHRPTGSIFKPFVFAAAFNTSLAGAQLTNSDGVSATFTPVTTLNDEQTTFTFAGNQTYTPKDFEGKYMGEVTARTALEFSLNNATISLAEMVGYNNVASLARDAGIKSARGTPAMAIGAYDATPLEMAGAYTVFANGGVKIDPWMVASVRNPNGDPVADYTPTTKPILDPRSAFLTTALMEDVINHGTAAGVRLQGFRAPAAGKTGTSHDAWFAGFTSNLLTIVWVGNDDYSDIKIEGAHAAAPIWADFMKRAIALPEYSDTKDFVPPSGVTQVTLDKATNLIADASCSEADYTAYFLDGTQPTDTCDHANGDQRNIFQRIFGLGEKPAAPPSTPGAQPVASQPATPVPAGQPQPAAQAPVPAVDDKPKKKPGFFRRLFGGGKKDNDDQSNQPAQPSTPQ
ncbi:PBP1A family penicillin-binding protein [Silvibacterium dinghuense]|uniref:PBP1A family penicillin-binding protein n=1 Tax=Silvibacterium dinghuense TaxID=1560006 RepID=A0A4Q1SED5_9BACT|nr:PBP1A family penicillin-binding protein [Silvibacterium dinghuense]RXS95622.1 PBP1A family penicillin-binding protein [Silvibacterium dinghuense]GGH14476.1 penicillin-binding protein 1B [Silvibacterium dinghuense]